MPWYPKAANHNIKPGTQDPPIVPRIICMHTMVGTIESAENHFRDGSGIEAHFGVAMDGRVWQWRDTAIQADAQAGGNDYCISIETEDGGDPSRPWTAVQLAQLDLLCTWIGRVHSIPMRLVASTSERGIGYHRQFAVWNPNNHSCPGDVRLSQLLHTLIPGLQEGDDVTKDELAAELDRRKYATHHDVAIAIHGGDPDPEPGRNSLDSLAAAVEVLEGKVDQIIANLTPTS